MVTKNSEMADSSYESSVGSPPPSTTEARTNRDSIKKGFSDFRKFAGTNFTRAKQVSYNLYRPRAQLLV